MILMVVGLVVGRWWLGRLGSMVMTIVVCVVLGCAKHKRNKQQNKTEQNKINVNFDK